LQKSYIGLSYVFMERKFIFSEDEFYHGYNRGVEKRGIFLSDRDYMRFVRLLYVANGTRSFVYRDIEDKAFADIDRGEPLVAIGAWALMPNHFHILVKEIREGGISAFMKKLLTGYSAYFNKLNERVGPLFQGTFQAQHADSDEYLKYLFAYIHLNPVKLRDPLWKEHGLQSIDKTKQFLSAYRYSSYLDYQGGEREEGLILSREQFPQYFLNAKDFDELMTDWLTFQPGTNT